MSMRRSLHATPNCAMPLPVSETDTIRCQVEAGVALVTFNRPERLNAFNAEIGVAPVAAANSRILPRSTGIS